ncbi:hypothetical protein Gotri_021234 [Gossypium trilobum]|uniref:Uncharacterized protein n=1 Tax=Gossypium trilobum TaxID=34281 RepID=A0A7J9DBU5_9ROSI|nr:hypothetical protein [Gossypium trilobum]
MTACLVSKNPPTVNPTLSSLKKSSMPPPLNPIFVTFTFPSSSSFSNSTVPSTSLSSMTFSFVSNPINIG